LKEDSLIIDFPLLSLLEESSIPLATSLLEESSIPLATTLGKEVTSLRPNQAEEGDLSRAHLG